MSNYSNTLLNMVITRVAAKDQWNNPHKTNKAHYHSYTRSVCIHTRHRILNTETTSRDQLRSPRNNNTSMPRAIVGRVPCYWCWVQGLSPLGHYRRPGHSGDGRKDRRIISLVEMGSLLSFATLGGTLSQMRATGADSLASCDGL